MVRVTCEDGREFIRKAALSIAGNSFPPFTGGPISKRLAKEQRRLRQTGELDASSLADIPLAPPRNYISHFVMNLPDSAIEFLDAFRGILNVEDSGPNLSASYQRLPMVHCHCFTRFLEESEAEADIKEVNCVGSVLTLC